MRITEKEFMILRYLPWSGPLFEHPDYRRVLSGKTTKVISGKGVPTLKNYLEDDSRPEMTEVYRRLNESWPELSSGFGYRVELLTQPFCAAIEEAREAFGRSPEVCLQYLAGRTFRGTLLIPHLDTSLSFDVTYNDSGRGLSSRRILQLGNSDSVVLFTDGRMLFVTRTMHLADLRTGETAPIEASSEFQTDLDFLDNVESFLTAYLCFLKFANVTEKFVTASGSRQGRQAGPGDWTNDTGVSVRLMNATYYTTTVRTEGFPRKGFFRMQPHKVGGEWTHYLKWIDATYVSGYTRKARKLIEEEDMYRDKKSPTEAGL